MNIHGNLEIIMNRLRLIGMYLHCDVVNNPKYVYSSVSDRFSILGQLFGEVTSTRKNRVIEKAESNDTTKRYVRYLRRNPFCGTIRIFLTTSNLQEYIRERVVNTKRYQLAVTCIPNIRIVLFDSYLNNYCYHVTLEKR